MGLLVHAGAAQAAPAASAAPAAEEPKAEEKTEFDVKLAGFDAAAKIKVIKEVRSITALGLKEAKELASPCSSLQCQLAIIPHMIRSSGGTWHSCQGRYEPLHLEPLSLKTARAHGIMIHHSCMEVYQSRPSGVHGSPDGPGMLLVSAEACGNERGRQLY